MVFLLAGVLTISSTLKLISLPAPLYSLYQALICLLGIGFFAGEARRYLAEQGGKLDLFSVGLRGGPLVFFAALLLVLAGYSNLAHYLVRSSIISIFFIIISYLAAPHRQWVYRGAFSGSPQWPVWGWSAGSGRPSKAG